MLGQTYRFTILNSTGQTLAANAVTIKPRRWKYASDGSLTDEASGAADVLAQAATLANAAYKNGTAQDNTVNKYIGGFFEISITAPASSAGNITVWRQNSVDGGTTWPTDGLGEPCAQVRFTAAGTKVTTIEL